MVGKVYFRCHSSLSDTLRRSKVYFHRQYFLHKEFRILHIHIYLSALSFCSSSLKIPRQFLLLARPVIHSSTNVGDAQGCSYLLSTPHSVCTVHFKWISSWKPRLKKVSSSFSRNILGHALAHKYPFLEFGEEKSAAEISALNPMEVLQWHLGYKGLT
jgi:hypothetical protein